MSNSKNLFSLLRATEDGDLETRDQILREEPSLAGQSLLDAAGKPTNQTALMAAAFHGHAECVRLLLPFVRPFLAEQWAGADSWSPLMAAANQGHASCVQALLSDFDPKTADSDGLTPLMLATRARSEASVRVLSPVSDLSATTEHGLTALDMALAQKSLNRWTLADLLADHLDAEQRQKLLSEAPADALPRLRSMMEKEELAEHVRSSDLTASVSAATGRSIRL